jgi:hypothetical protein
MLDAINSALLGSLLAASLPGIDLLKDNIVVEIKLWPTATRGVEFINKSTALEIGANGLIFVRGCCIAEPKVSIVDH